MTKSNVTIGGIATDLLKSGKSAQETLEIVQRVFPGCKTTIKCIYYYASKAKVALQPKQNVDAAELKKALAEIKAA